MQEATGNPRTASAYAPPTAVTKAGPSGLSLTRVPPGMHIKWFQRKETISIEVDSPGCQEAQIDVTEEGLLTMVGQNSLHTMTLQLAGRVNLPKSRWWKSGRAWKFELYKASYGAGHWDKLLMGEKHSNVLIDWTSWIDEDEENEVGGGSQAPNSPCPPRRAPSRLARLRTHSAPARRADPRGSVRPRHAPHVQRDGVELGEQR